MLDFYFYYFIISIAIPNVSRKHWITCILILGWRYSDITCWWTLFWKRVSAIYSVYFSSSNYQWRNRKYWKWIRTKNESKESWAYWWLWFRCHCRYSINWKQWQQRWGWMRRRKIFIWPRFSRRLECWTLFPRRSKYLTTNNYLFDNQTFPIKAWSY